MSRRKQIGIILAALAIAALLLWSFRPQPVAVTVATVARGPLAVTVLQEGMTQVRDRYRLSAPVTAYAPRLPLEVGDPVGAGETLLSLRPVPSVLLDPRTRSQAEARVAQAEAGLQAQQARLQAAESELELAREQARRFEELFAARTVPRDTLDQARARLQQAEAERNAARFAVESARGELAAARAALGDSAGEPDTAREIIPVVSPVGGVVLAIDHKSAAVVNAGQPLLTVGDPARLEVQADVLSTAAVLIRPGMRVLFEEWGGGDRLEGVVRTVQPAAFTDISALGVEEQRVYVIADFVAPREAWTTLGDGYRVEARFILWEEEDVLKAPASALFREGDGWAAFVIDDGRARRRPVTVGRRGEFEVQIIDGLAAGESVITYPGDAVADGVRVVPREPS